MFHWQKAKYILLPETQLILFQIADEIVHYWLAIYNSIFSQDRVGTLLKAEEMAVNLYLDAARELPEGDDKKVFAVLAQEEKQHKLDLETEYRELKTECS